MNTGVSVLPMHPALVATTDQISGYRIVHSLGVAEGICVNPRSGFTAAGQREALQNAMKEAFLLMLEQAAAQGAQAIVGLRYAIPQSESGHLVVAYGTAVVVEQLI